MAMAMTKTKTKKRTVPAAKVSPKDVATKVDPKLKRLWDETRAAIVRAKGAGSSAFDELWEAVGRALSHEPPLYVLGGYASPAEFFREELHEEARTARRYVRVARFATPKEEDTYGIAVLDSALGYLEAKVGHALDGTLPVAFDRLKIPIAEGKATRSVPLAKATVAQINAATRALSKTATRRGPKSALRDAMLSAMKGSSILAGVRVHEANGILSFTHVPAGGLGAFVRALGAARTALDADSKKNRRSATGAR